MQRPLWFDQGNRRHVAPYFHMLRVRAKGRWLDRTAVDVFTSEFAHHDRAYYVSAAEEKRLYVERRPPPALKRLRSVTPTSPHPPAAGSGSECGDSCANQQLSAVDTPIARDDWICHQIHKHELSVFSVATPEIVSVQLEEGKPFFGIMCVNKPSSLPTHPSGRYHYNSCVAMLEEWLTDICFSAVPADSEATTDEVFKTGSLPFNDADHGYKAVPSRSLVRCADKDRQALREFITRPRSGSERQLHVRACHRLDKATSGVLLCALTAEAARVVGDMLAAKTRVVESMAESWLEKKATMQNSSRVEEVALETFPIRKTYVARVVGKFPGGGEGDGIFPLLVPVANNKEADWLIEEPLPVEQKWKQKGGGGGGDDAAAAEDNGCDDDMESRRRPSTPTPDDAERSKQFQSAVTLCRLLHYDTTHDESVVQCIPLTGRTHQIRRHLLLAGFPIANDTKYNPQAAASCEQNRHEVFFSYDELPDAIKKVTERDPLCYECKQLLPVTQSGDLESMIYLHAWKYQFGWSSGSDEVRVFETELPAWAVQVV